MPFIVLDDETVLVVRDPDFTSASLVIRSGTGPPGPPGTPGADSTVPGPPGADSTVPGPPGADGADSTVPGPPGADSTVPGPPGADSTVPGPPGADSVVPGPPGADGADSTVPGPPGADGADSTVPGPPGADGADSTVPGPPGADSTVPGPPGADSTVPGPPGDPGPPGSDADITAHEADLTPHEAAGFAVETTSDNRYGYATGPLPIQQGDGGQAQMPGESGTVFTVLPYPWFLGEYTIIPEVTTDLTIILDIAHTQVAGTVVSVSGCGAIWTEIHDADNLSVWVGTDAELQAVSNPPHPDPVVDRITITFGIPVLSWAVASLWSDLPGTVAMVELDTGSGPVATFPDYDAAGRELILHLIRFDFPANVGSYGLQQSINPPRQSVTQANTMLGSAQRIVHARHLSLAPFPALCTATFTMSNASEIPTWRALTLVLDPLPSHQIFLEDHLANPDPHPRDETTDEYARRAGYQEFTGDHKFTGNITFAGGPDDGAVYLSSYGVWVQSAASDVETPSPPASVVFSPLYWDGANNQWATEFYLNGTADENGDGHLVLTGAGLEVPSLIVDGVLYVPAATAIANHEAAANPHDSYLTQSEADTLYADDAHTHTGSGATYLSTFKWGVD